MPVIASVASAIPDHVVTQEEARDLAKQLFSGHFRDIDRLLQIFSTSAIEKRHFCVPPSWFAKSRSLREKNDRYLIAAEQLGREAAEKALTAAALSPQDIDAILFVSSTGIATPSLDVKLIQALGMRRDVARMPLFGLGCAGGASGLARAAEWAKAHPTGAVLLVAVELCGLTFVHGDHSKSNLIGTALFADGAAACVVVGDERRSPEDKPFAGPSIIGNMSYVWPDMQDVMGWDVRDEGLSVVFSRDIPSIVEREIAGQLSALLRKYDIAREQLVAFVAHPGGMKVLRAYETALQLPESWLELARDVLQNFGNMSSPTVLFVLERLLQSAPDSGYAAVAALGPGFSCEQVLLQFAEPF
ncbi:MAG: type III polyketide synthase [Bacilli bacterium]